MLSSRNDNQRYDRNTGILPVRRADLLFASPRTQRSATPLGAQTESLCSVIRVIRIIRDQNSSFDNRARFESCKRGIDKPVLPRASEGPHISVLITQPSSHPSTIFERSLAVWRGSDESARHGDASPYSVISSSRLFISAGMRPR